MICNHPKLIQTFTRASVAIKIKCESHSHQNIEALRQFNLHISIKGMKKDEQKNEEEEEQNNKKKMNCKINVCGIRCIIVCVHCTYVHTYLYA